MGVRRDLGKLSVVAALFGACLVMLARVVGSRSPWLGLLLTFHFMGLAKVAEPLFQLRMPHALRRVDRSVVTAGVYRWLGVRGFGILLRSSPLRHLNGSVYLGTGRRGLAALNRQAESAEATHFWAAVLFAPYIAYVGSRGLLAEAACFAVVQVVFNLYPILHPRAPLGRDGAGPRGNVDA